jgi:hypothetical protein
MPGTLYKWILATGGDVGVASNWSPFTNGSPGTTPPGSADEADFANAGGTITGNLTVDQWVIDGSACLPRRKPRSSHFLSRHEPEG